VSVFRGIYAASLRRAVPGVFRPRLSSGPSAAMRATANKIITAANAYSAPTNMTTAPTAAMGTAGAISTLNSAALNSPSYLVTDNTKFRQPANAWTAAGSGVLFGSTPALSSQSSGLFDGGQGWSLAFQTTGLTAFDMMLTGFAGGNRKFAVRVNGQWAQTADFSLALATGTRAYAKVTMNQTVTGLVEVFFDTSFYIAGMNVNAGATLTAPTTDTAKPIGVIWGDSFTHGNTGYTTHSQPGFLFLQKLGVVRPDLMGRSGQGYVLQTDSRNIQDRVPLDAARLVQDAEIAVAYGSVNDNAQVAGSIQTAAATMVTNLRTAHPNAWVVIYSSFSGVNGPMYGARNSAFRDGALSAADSRTIVIDTEAAGWEQITNVANALPGGYGNHDSPDGVHPGPNETAYLTDLMKSSLLTRLAAAIA
jgi:hypothetical protein